jgi:nucleoid-associated protein YgaU
MKKVIFALAILATSIGSFAQEAKTPANGGAKKEMKNLSPEERATHLKERILRITATDNTGTAQELYNTALTFFKAKAEIQASSADKATAAKKIAEAKATREVTFQKILGAERYAKLEAARKRNTEKKAKAGPGTFIDEAIEE